MTVYDRECWHSTQESATPPELSVAEVAQQGETEKKTRIETTTQPATTKNDSNKQVQKNRKTKAKQN
jgi:hypothetical protein